MTSFRSFVVRFSLQKIAMNIENSFINGAIPLVFAVCATGILHGALAAEEDQIFVDPQLSEAATTSYDPATRKSSGGSRQAFKTLKAAAEAAVAGQTVLLRAGTYTEPLAPKNSGVAGRYITFRNYQGEEAVISGKSLSPAIDLSQRQYVAIEGLKIIEVDRWLLARKAKHIVLKGNTFRQALCPGGSSKTGLFFEESSHNKVLENVIDDSTQDNLALIKSDRNLVEGNVFTRAKHVLWTIKGGNFNVIRRNYLHNAIQKIGEVYDCEHVGFERQFTEFNVTKHNLIERNVFAFTPSSGDHSPFAGVQYAGQEGIIRHNIFYGTIGPAFDFTLYPEEARFNTENRLYNNVFYNTHFAGIHIAGMPDDGKYAFSGNVIRNNILLKNIFTRNDKRWEWYKELDGKPVQVFVGALKGFLLERNALFNEKPGEKYLIVAGRRDSKSRPPPQDLAGWQAAHPNLFRDNLEIDPQFVDAAKHDFRLKPGSPAIDAGAFLTRAKDAGEGASLEVQDARWFCDGFGIEGLAGDEIQLQGQTQPVRITKVNYETNILTLAAPLKWSDGQGVALPYAGKAPDLGVFEFGAPEPALPPPAPAGLQQAGGGAPK